MLDRITGVIAFVTFSSNYVDALLDSFMVLLRISSTALQGYIDNSLIFVQNFSEYFDLEFMR